MMFTRVIALSATLASLALAVPVRRQDGPYTLPPLDYAYTALEPHISGEIMTLHHDKHHQAAITALNTAQASYEKLGETDVAEKIRLSASIKFNGGSHINHSLFWKNLAPTNSDATKPTAAPKLMEAITNTWGSFEKFQASFVEKTGGIQGSGWGWLGYSDDTEELEIVALPNQDPLLTHVPIIGVDIWEHSFYLQYKNVKADYLKAIWNVINWQEAERRFTTAASASN